jgi:hypothetical protein
MLVLTTSDLIISMWQQGRDTMEITSRLREWGRSETEADVARVVRAYLDQRYRARAA